MALIKADAGVPLQLQSCHTTLIGDYVFEGHIPADVIARFLDEKPNAKGLAVPGMPIGSPGMEGPGARPYAAYSFDHSGQLKVFAEIDPR